MRKKTLFGEGEGREEKKTTSGNRVRGGGGIFFQMLAQDVFSPTMTKFQ